MMRRLWTRIWCWWYDICPKHGTVKRYRTTVGYYTVDFWTTHCQKCMDEWWEDYKKRVDGIVL